MTSSWLPPAGATWTNSARTSRRVGGVEGAKGRGQAVVGAFVLSAWRWSGTRNTTRCLRVQAAVLSFPSGPTRTAPLALGL
jgi:hypothetical protein